MRHIITDEIREVFGPMVRECRSPLGPEPELSDRLFLEAVLYWARTGVPWRDLPSEFGDWSAVYNRLRRWIHSGRLKRLFEAMTERPECEGLRRVMIDSTIVRAHQHAAGAAKKKGGRGPGDRPLARRADDEGHRRRLRRGRGDRRRRGRGATQRRAAGRADPGGGR
jgi:transposase